MENWLAVGVGVFLVAMMLYGHYKGLIRLSVSMAALIATLVIVNLAMPQVRNVMKDETFIHNIVRKGMLSAAGIDNVPQEGTEIPSVQRMAIEELNLPQQLKEALIENNNNEVYQMLGVNQFTEYVSSYLTNTILSIALYVILFFAVLIMLHLIMHWLDIVAKLPILSGLNQIAGAVVGLVEGLIFVWIASLIITAFSGTEWGNIVISQIESSSWLSLLYNNNILVRVAMGVMQKML